MKSLRSQSDLVHVSSKTRFDTEQINNSFFSAIFVNANYHSDKVYSIVVSRM
ncbi:hypothetical protein BgiMline_034894, partial [Biomphalaria glabrata]